jgi:heme exporter protein D
LKRASGDGCADNLAMALQANTNAAILIPPPGAAEAAGTNDIRDIKPPVPVPNPWFWVWLAVTVTLLALAAHIAWRQWRKRQLLRPAVPPIPAHIRAKQKLQGALGLLHDPRLFCTLVADTIRVYLEERFRFHAPDRTTEEFMIELQASTHMTPDQKESLAAFLQSCDMVKFARYEPAEVELRALLESALRLIDETEFEPLQSTAVAGPPPVPQTATTTS